MKINFGKSPTVRFRFVYFLFPFLTIMLFFPACIVTHERPSTYYQEQPPSPQRPDDLRRIQGIWHITSNNYPGKLEIYLSGNRWAGRINFDPHLPWDQLTDFFFDARTGEIQFSRPTYQTRYTGTLSGNQLSGTFTEAGRSYPWEARRELPDSPRQVDLRRIQGLWYITSNSYPGKLDIYWSGNRWTGRINFDPNVPWDPISDIVFDPRTGEIQFSRPTYQTRYTGTLSGNQMSGAFTEAGRSYPWEARRELVHRPVDLRRIQGLWQITSNSYPGKLEFYWTGTRWAGRINFDPSLPWDELIDIFFEPQTGQIQFTRPTYNTRYSGTLSGNQMSGTFTEVGRSFPWEARKTR